MMVFTTKIAMWNTIKISCIVTNVYLQLCLTISGAMTHKHAKISFQEKKSKTKETKINIIIIKEFNFNHNLSYGLMNTRSRFTFTICWSGPTRNQHYPIIVNIKFLTYHKFPQQILITQKQQQQQLSPERVEDTRIEVEGQYKSTSYDGSLWNQ